MVGSWSLKINALMRDIFEFAKGTELWPRKCAVQKVVESFWLTDIEMFGWLEGNKKL